jgi:quinol-cytochrome oxidoreductase complex cytochrome b subunit
VDEMPGRSPATPSASRHKLRRLLTAALTLAAACTAVVAATGIWLARNYRPATPELVGPRRYRFVLGGGWVHETHVWAAIVLLAAAVAVLVLVLVDLVRLRPSAARWLTVLTAAAVVAAVAVGLRSSKGLRWNSLALWAVTIGSNYRGVWQPAYSKAIRFVLIDGEVSPYDYRRRVAAHLLGTPALLAAAALLLAITLWRARSDE